MATFSVDDMAELSLIVSRRVHELNMEVVDRNIHNVTEHIIKILNKDSIFERLKEKCSTHVYPWDLKIGIYGYNGNKKLESNSQVTLDYMIDRPAYLFYLDKMFNSNCPPGDQRFRVTVRNMEGCLHGWREIMLHYYVNGVPRKLIRPDPEIADGLPASPIEMNPEDNEMHPLGL